MLLESNMSIEKSTNLMKNQTRKLLNSSMHNGKNVYNNFNILTLYFAHRKYIFISYDSYRKQIISVNCINLVDFVLKTPF
jgi:hypothetical protein